MHFSIKEALSTAWSKLKANFALLIGAFFLWFLIVAILGYIANIISGDRHSLISGALNLAVSLISIVLAMGIIKIVLAVIDERRAHLSELFKSWGLLLPFVAAYFLVWLAITIGLILLIIPGIIWAIQFSFFAYFIIDKGLGPIAALRASSDLTQGKKWELLGFYAVLLLINCAGVLVFGIGVLISFPSTFLAQAYAYRRLSSGA